MVFYRGRNNGHIQSPEFVRTWNQILKSRTELNVFPSLHANIEQGIYTSFRQFFSIDCIQIYHLQYLFSTQIYSIIESRR